MQRYRTGMPVAYAAALLLFVLLLWSAISCQAADSYAPGELLVKFSPQAVSNASTIHNRMGARVLTVYSSLNWQRVRLPAGVSVSQAIQSYQGQSGVVTVEPNYIYHATATPNDPGYNQLWGISKINAPTAWNTSTGSNSVVVAVVDTGVNYNHPDLAANMWVNPGNIPGDSYSKDVHGINVVANSGDPLDDFGHGSHVAGTIGAVGNNSVGVVGINWKVKIMALKFLDNTGSGTTADAITCYQYAINMKQHGVNIRVINDSWGGSSFSQALEDVIVQAANNGILSVCAAGNSGVNTDAIPQYPSAFPVAGVISVAASDQSDNPATFTNYGAKTVHLAAPGVGIYSTYLNNSYTTLSGTSMATPHVAGAAALVLAVFPSLSVADLKARLLSSVDPLPKWAGKSASGGRLNVAKALLGSTPPPPTYTYQPDLLIGTIAGSYQGGGVYGPVPVQQLTGNIAPGSTLTYYLRVQNNGSAADSFKLYGQSSNSGWTTTYYNAVTGGSNITSAIASSGGWDTGQLSPGQYRELRALVSPGVNPLSSFSWWVKAYSNKTTSASDIVQSTVYFTSTLTNLRIQASISSPAKVNSNITIFAFVNGASPQFRFRIGYPNSLGVMSWSVLQSYSTLSNTVWHPTTARTYTIEVSARPAGSTADYTLQQTLSYQVVN